MKTLKERIKEGFPKTEEEDLFKDPINIALEIACVGHNGQYRDNGEPYLSHPGRLYSKFNRLISLGDNKEISYEALLLNGIPYYGVAEVCFLHDVVEDTGITHEEIRNLYVEYGYGDYFDECIDTPLRLITHDKNEPYETYIKKIITNPTASLVKLLDLSDNLNPFGLSHLDEYSVERSKRYIDYFKMINDKHLFLAKFINARRMEENCADQNKDGGEA